VTDEAIAEWRRRQPHVAVVVVEGAGHAVQSDKPVVLAGLLSDLLDGSSAPA
jgi:pimeloyl-ACP methyl ester carboxylesterase